MGKFDNSFCSALLSSALPQNLFNFGELKMRG